MFNSFKTPLASLGLAVALHTTGAAAAEGDHHDLRPKHGGVVSQGGHMEYELVIKTDATLLYMRDHGKPVAPGNSSAKLVVVEGREKLERSLTAQDDALKGPGVNLKGSAYTAVATVEFADRKKSTVRFKSK